MMLYTIKNKRPRQLLINLDGTDNTKTTLVMPPDKLKKVRLSRGQYQYIRSTYKNDIIVRQLSQ